MLRTAQLLPLVGLLTLGFDAGRFPPAPPVCYRASWQLPGPDLHRQAMTSLRSKDRLQHRSHLRSTGRTAEEVEPLFALLYADDPRLRGVKAQPHRREGVCCQVTGLFGPLP
jgi:hypothetical protein